MKALIKGISGGQRKRTSVGVEIITDPDVQHYFFIFNFYGCDLIVILLTAALP